MPSLLLDGGPTVRPRRTRRLVGPSLPGRVPDADQREREQPEYHLRDDEQQYLSAESPALGGVGESDQREREQRDGQRVAPAPDRSEHGVLAGEPRRHADPRAQSREEADPAAGDDADDDERDEPTDDADDDTDDDGQ